jgi:hypothetical protein
MMTKVPYVLHALRPHIAAGHRIRPFLAPDRACGRHRGPLLDITAGSGAQAAPPRRARSQALERHWPLVPKRSIPTVPRIARRSGSPATATLVTAELLKYWLGQWDDALAELSMADQDAPGLTYYDLRDRGHVLLLHGVAALIAGRRGQRTTAGQQLRMGLGLLTQSLSDRENQDFLVAAHALAKEQSGETRQAMLVLAAILPRRDDEMTLVHQWLPDLVRLAIAAGDGPVAQAAAQACEAEAAAETQSARAATASLRCHGLLESDPVPLREAVARYRTAGPAVEMPAALEDLAVVLAGRGREDEAKAVVNEAVGLYDAMRGSTPAPAQPGTACRRCTRGKRSKPGSR